MLLFVATSDSLSIGRNKVTNNRNLFPDWVSRNHFIIFETFCIWQFFQKMFTNVEEVQRYEQVIHLVLEIHSNNAGEESRKQQVQHDLVAHIYQKIVDHLKRRMFQESIGDYHLDLLQSVHASSEVLFLIFSMTLSVSTYWEL